MNERSEQVKCRNCDQILTGDYCSSCGQRDIDFERNWKGLVEEYASSLFNFDGKVPRGIYELLFKPGLASKRFLQGKRASQIPPMRLYLFANLIYFVWVAYAYQPTDDGGANPSRDPPGLQSVEESATNNQELHSLLAKKFDNPESIVANFYVWLPRVSLFGVPLLAMVTWLMFRKRGFVYLEHIIVSIHFLTFYLLWSLLADWAGLLLGFVWAGSDSNVEDVVSLWLLVYPIFALRRIFSLGWGKAIGFTILLEIIFSLLMGALLIAVGSIAYWLS